MPPDDEELCSGGRSHESGRRRLGALGSCSPWWAFHKSGLLYSAVAAACTLLIGSLFFGSMRQQVRLLHAELAPDALTAHLRALGFWSAPLDDVFIHFDFARSMARGAPFEWVEGNGYSSGGTSAVYPLVLAVGWWLGFRDLRLMLWAGAVAVVAVFSFLLACRRMFRALPPASALVLPPAVLAVGVLDWNLFSGMEVALYLGIWGGAFAAWDRLTSGSADQSSTAVRRSLALGAWGGALVATRPEGVTSVAVLALGAALCFLARGLPSRAALIATVTALPGMCVTGLQSLANLTMTGESAAAGAISKLEIHDPYRPAAQALLDWKFFIQYQIDRITEYHLADDGRHGWLVWYLAVVPLAFDRTRRYALLLWASIIPWVMMVGLNGQVRWQNERYSMPALAWLLVLAGLGVAALVTADWRRPWRALPNWVFGVTLAGLCVGGFALHERARFVDQLWFFGRASRNILEQHVRTGLALRHLVEPTPKRVAVGDAGAIPYVADLPALDLIGLGGYSGLPFARAKRNGIGAVLELVERMPADRRPDLLALYPAWWDMLPLWFGTRLFEVPVHGNVICGGPNKVVYRADWSSFRDSARPVGPSLVGRVADELDVGDLVSEADHAYELSEPRAGHIEMKVLANPAHPAMDLWDAGRIVPPGTTERFRFSGLTPDAAVRLVFRAAPVAPELLEVRVGGRSYALELPRANGWLHPELSVGQSSGHGTLEVQVQAKNSSRTSFHIWAVQ